MGSPPIFCFPPPKNWHYHRVGIDSISRDGPDMPIYIIHSKKNNLEQEEFKAF